MKYLKKFNESDVNIASLVGDMVADINDDYPWMVTNVEEINDEISINISKNTDQSSPEKMGYVNLEIVLNKMNQVLEQIPDYEIVKIALYFYAIGGTNKIDYSDLGPYKPTLPSRIGPDKSYLLFKHTTSNNINSGIRQGFTGCDKLSNIDKYIDVSYRHVTIILSKKHPSKVRKFFNFFK